jgi:hypothetical protein
MKDCPELWYWCCSVRKTIILNTDSPKHVLGVEYRRRYRRRYRRMYRRR